MGIMASSLLDFVEKLHLICWPDKKLTKNEQLTGCALRRSVVPRKFVRGGGLTNSVERRGQRERGSGGGSPLVRGSGGSCNLVQEI